MSKKLDDGLRDIPFRFTEGVELSEADAFDRVTVEMPDMTNPNRDYILGVSDDFRVVAELLRLRASGLKTSTLPDTCLDSSAVRLPDVHTDDSNLTSIHDRLEPSQRSEDYWIQLGKAVETAREVLVHSFDARGASERGQRRQLTAKIFLERHQSFYNAFLPELNDPEVMIRPGFKYWLTDKERNELNIPEISVETFERLREVCQHAFLYGEGHLGNAKYEDLLQVSFNYHVPFRINGQLFLLGLKINEENGHVLQMVMIEGVHSGRVGYVNDTEFLAVPSATSNVDPYPVIEPQKPVGWKRLLPWNWGGK